MPGRGRRWETTADAGSTVAGYRLVRLVGRGAACQVFLGRPAHLAASPDTRHGNVAVKIVPATDRSRAEAEILALRMVTSEHVVELVDVATLADGGLCLAQSLGSRGTAAALLARRGSLTPGETVTLVASVLRGLGDLHEAGLAHGALDLSHVLLDGTGRPMLGGLGSSQPLTGAPTTMGRRGGDLREQDLVRVARIAQALHDPADGRGRASDSRWDAWTDLLDAAIHGESDLTAHDLADRLLEVADAAPLADVADPEEEDGRRLADDARDPDRSAAGGIGAPLRPAAPRGRGARRAASRARPLRRHRATSARSDAASTNRVHAVRVAVARELATVRPRIWLLGAGALAILAVAVVALPLATGSAHGASADEEAAPVAASSASALDPETTTSTAEDVATDVDPDIARTADADVRAASADDVDLAVPALLRLRAACLREGDAACLSRADQPGSAVEDADLARIAAGGEDARDEASLHVSDERGPAQHLGDSALVELRSVDGPGVTEAPAASGPGRRTASLLVVRGEAGWRIRDLMDDR